MLTVSVIKEINYFIALMKMSSGKSPHSSGPDPEWTDGPETLKTVNTSRAPAQF